MHIQKAQHQAVEAMISEINKLRVLVAVEKLHPRIHQLDRILRNLGTEFTEAPKPKPEPATITLETETLTEAALDWAVAQAQKVEVEIIASIYHGTTGVYVLDTNKDHRRYQPSADYSRGGPIMAEAGIATRQKPNKSWTSGIEDYRAYTEVEGPTQLVAAMRWYVASFYGSTIRVPASLAAY